MIWRFCIISINPYGSIVNIVLQVCTPQKWQNFSTGTCLFFTRKWIWPYNPITCDRPTRIRVLPNGDKVLYSTFCIKVLLVPRRSSYGDFKLNFNKMFYWPQALPSRIMVRGKDPAHIQGSFYIYLVCSPKMEIKLEPFISCNTYSKELCPHKKDIADPALWKSHYNRFEVVYLISYFIA